MIGQPSAVAPAPWPYEAPSGLRPGLLWQIALCVLPAVAMLGARHPYWGGRYFFGSLLLMLAVHIVRRDPVQFSALLIAVMPAMMFFRDFLFYSSIQVLLVVNLALWLVVARRRVVTLLTTPTTAILLVLAVLYWLLSFLVMENYAANYRTIELALTACFVVLLGQHRSFLSTALLGVGITACANGAGMLPISVRLGMVDMDHLRLGNPIQLGNPCALVFLLTLVDNGSFLGLREHRFFRMILRICTAAVLLLTTSRGAWLIVIVGMAVLFVFDRQRRTAILASLSLVVILAAGLISIGHSSILNAYIDKTFSPDTSWNKRTTGRAQQWQAIPKVISASPVWGFGPGTGRDVAGEYAGRWLAWHSLYLQVLAETGLLGGLICFGCLAILTAKTLRYRRRTGDITPLIGILGYLTICVSVPGIDGNSAIFLGLGLLSGYSWRVWALRPCTWPELEQSAADGCSADGAGGWGKLRAAPAHLPPSVLGDGCPPAGPAASRPLRWNAILPSG